MKNIRLILSLLFLAGMLGYSAADVWAQGPQGVKAGVIEATALNKEGTFCRLKFPAIEPGTLASDRPVLKSPDSGDIVDYYGPCDHDPVGYEEVCRQKVESQHALSCD